MNNINKGGRPPKLNDREIKGLKMMLERGVSKETIMMTYNISLRKYYEYKKEVSALNLSSYIYSNKPLKNSAETSEEEFFSYLTFLLNGNGLRRTYKQYLTKSEIHRIILKTSKDNLGFPKGYTCWYKMSNTIDKFISLYGDKYYVEFDKQYIPLIRKQIHSTKIYTHVYEEVMSINYYNNKGLIIKEEYYDLNNQQEFRDKFGDIYYIEEIINKISKWYKVIWDDQTKSYDNGILLKSKPFEIGVENKKEVIDAVIKNYLSNYYNDTYNLYDNSFIL